MTEIQEKKLPKLTKKRKGFVKDYVETGVGAEAARRNFNVSNDNSARAVASELLTFPNVVAAIEKEQQTLKQALEKQGVTPAKIAKKVDELLEAKGKDKNQAIDKGLKHATAIYGVVDESDKPKSNNTYNFIFNTETQAEIKQIEDKIKAQLIHRHESIQES